MPPHLARLAMCAFARSTASAGAIGWMFQLAGKRGLFLPEESNDPAWPQGTTYLTAGENITLPPPNWRITEREDASGWVCLEGPLLSQPLLVHPIVTLIAAGHSSCASPES